jgi:hypothetical protein
VLRKKPPQRDIQGRNAVGTPSSAPRGSADGKSLSAFSLKPQSDRLLEDHFPKETPHALLPGLSIDA